MVRHSEWKEWASYWGINAKGPECVLTNSSKRLLGIYSNLPKECIPSEQHNAWLDFAVSVGHELMDEMWTEFDEVTRSYFELFFALYLLHDEKWEDEILDNPKFMRLQDYVLWGILPGFYSIFKSSPDSWLCSEIEKVVDQHLRTRGTARQQPYDTVAGRTSKKLLRVLEILANENS